MAGSDGRGENRALMLQMQAGDRRLTGSASTAMSAEAERDHGIMSPAARVVLDVARGVLDELDVELVLDRVLRSAMTLTEARYAAIGVLNDERTGLARFITKGIDSATRRRIGPPPTGHGVLGELIRNPVALRLSDVGAHPRSYGFPAGHPPMKSFLGVPVLVAGEPFGNLYLTDKLDGGAFTDADEEALVLLAEFAGVGIDHARRYSGAETRRRELQHTVDALDAMVQISRVVGGETDLATVLELVAKRGRALVSARALIIELERGTELKVAAAAGEVPPGIVGRRIPFGGSVADAALRTQRVQRLEDDLNRARFDERGLGSLGFDADGGLVVPLALSGRSLGVLIVVDRLEDGPRFSVEDERLLEAFAASAATAVATAHSVADDRRGQRLAAAEEERRRWARELHDETLQGLAALRLSLSRVRRASDPAGLDATLDAAIEGLEHEIATLRALVTDLRPPALDELGVKAAIEALAARAAGNGLEVEIHVDLGDGRTRERHSPELETALYRIVQEALTNAAKHGGAEHAVVKVREGGQRVDVTVTDDGAGFDTAAPTAGFGVLGMRERAELLLGTLEVQSTPGGPTAVRASLPASRRERASEPPAPMRKAG